MAHLKKAVLTTQHIELITAAKLFYKLRLVYWANGSGMKKATAAESLCVYVCLCVFVCRCVCERVSEGWDVTLISSVDE